jgi:hypothetical protein
MDRLVAVSAICLALVVAHLSAQHRLEPDQSIFASGLIEYYRGVRMALLADVPAAAAVVVVLPSFEPEWAAWSVRAPRPSACSRVAASPIWNGDKPDVPNVSTPALDVKCAAISPGMAGDLAQAWETMLRRVAYPPPSGTIGLDGTTYHFSLLALDRQLAGKVWSPKPESETGRLVSVAEALRAFTSAPSGDTEAALCESVVALRVNGRRLTSACRRQRPGGS